MDWRTREARELLDQLPVAITVHELDGTVVAMNRAAEQLYGRAAADVIGRSPASMLADEADVDRAQEVLAGIRAGAPWHGELEISRPDGTSAVGSFTAAPFTDAEGAVGSVGVIVADITERKQVEDAERSARRDAEDLADRLGRLQDLTGVLAAATTEAEVVEGVLTQAHPALDATAAAVLAVSGDGNQLELLDHLGLQPAIAQGWGRFPVAAPTPAGDAVRDGRAVLIASLADRDERYPVFRGTPTALHAFAILPLTTGRNVIGALVLAWEADRDFDKAEVDFLQSVADQSATALQRARLTEAERRRAGQQAFLAAASAALGESLDYERTLSQLATLLVPEIGDSSSVYLVESDGLRLVALANATPGRESLMRELAEREGARIRNPQLDAVVATREPYFTPVVPPELWAEIAEDEDHRRLLEALSVASGMAVPLIAHGVVVGVLAVTRDPDKTPFDAEDLRLIEDLGQRAAAAITNARAHQVRTETAQTLQRSLLPPSAPAIPGLDVAAIYRPVGDGSEVGGDFYDVITTETGHVLVMGDVSGKGVPAAALTARARHTIRAALLWEGEPSGALRVLNRSIVEDDLQDQFCTIVLARLTLEGDHVRVTYSCGGHPPPLIVTAAGDMRELGAPGTVIGLFPNPELRDTPERLNPGDTLVLYTDGITEARSPDGRFDPELIERVIRSTAGRDAAEVAAAIEEAVLAFQGGTPRDDMAVLVVRAPAELASRAVAESPLFDERYAAETPSVPAARRAFAQWLLAIPGGQVAHDDCVMIVAELVANAARAARQTFRLRAWVDHHMLTIEVADDGTGIAGELPDPRQMPSMLAEQGRGLYLVQLLGDELNIYSGPGGTVVRAMKNLL